MKHKEKASFKSFKSREKINLQATQMNMLYFKNGANRH